MPPAVWSARVSFFNVLMLHTIALRCSPCPVELCFTFPFNCRVGSSLSVLLGWGMGFRLVPRCVALWSVALCPLSLLVCLAHFTSTLSLGLTRLTFFDCTYILVTDGLMPQGAHVTKNSPSSGCRTGWAQISTRCPASPPPRRPCPPTWCRRKAPGGSAFLKSKITATTMKTRTFIGPDFLPQDKKPNFAMKLALGLDVQTNAKGGKFMSIEDSHQGGRRLHQGVMMRKWKHACLQIGLLGPSLLSDPDTLKTLTPTCDPIKGTMQTASGTVDGVPTFPYTHIPIMPPDLWWSGLTSKEGLCPVVVAKGPRLMCVKPPLAVMTPFGSKWLRFGF